MNGAPEISVVMANYNTGSYLEPAIRSLQSQSLGSWELILVDDASTDGSGTRAEELAGADERIRVVCLPANSGPAAARNCALALARGRWIAVFDGDDIMQPTRLEVLMTRARADRAAIVADNMLEFSKNRRPKLLFPRSWSRRPRWIGLAEFIDSNRLHTRVRSLGYLKPLIDAEALRRLSIRYDEQLRIGEDYDFMARLLASGLNLRLEPQPLYCYRRHPNSISYRLRHDDIVRLIEAEERFDRSVFAPTPATLRAMQRRKRSLKTMLHYDGVVAAIKRGHYATATVSILAMPDVWPMLMQPIAARVRRLRVPQRTASRTVPAGAEQPVIASAQPSRS